MIVVVPVAGAGTYADPKRPVFLPPRAGDVKLGAGWVSWSWQPSDDGRFAVVEAAFRNPAAAKVALRNVPLLAAFDRHSSKRADVERDIRRFRKDFSLDGPVTPGRPR